MENQKKSARPEAPLETLVMFRSCRYDSLRGGHPVVRYPELLVAVFICEEEAEDYASYRNAMLAKHDTTDVSVYNHND